MILPSRSLNKPQYPLMMHPSIFHANHLNSSVILPQSSNSFILNLLPLQMCTLMRDPSLTKRMRIVSHIKSPIPLTHLLTCFKPQQTILGRLSMMTSLWWILGRRKAKRRRRRGRSQVMDLRTYQWLVQITKKEETLMKKTSLNRYLSLRKIRRNLRMNPRNQA
jgi:hypothetical protein